MEQGNDMTDVAKILVVDDVDSNRFCAAGYY